MPLIMIVSAFAALVGYGRAPRASIYMGAMFLFGIQIACQMTFNALAVTFTAILFAIRFKKILGKIEKQKD